MLSPDVSVSGHVYDMVTGRVTTIADARYPYRPRHGRGEGGPLTSHTTDPLPTGAHHPRNCREDEVMPFIETTDGTSLFVTDWGSGPPVMLTHAWGLRPDQWNYHIPALAEAGLRCVLYAGHGLYAGDHDADLLAFINGLHRQPGLPHHART